MKSDIVVVWRRTTDSNGVSGLRGHIRGWRHHYATVYSTGQWWVWDRYGVGGENGTESGYKYLDGGLDWIRIPFMMRAVEEAEAALIRAKEADE